MSVTQTQPTAPDASRFPDKKWEARRVDHAKATGSPRSEYAVSDTDFIRRGRIDTASIDSTLRGRDVHAAVL
jgi:hypothetical protein